VILFQERDPRGFSHRKTAPKQQHCENRDELADVAPQIAHMQLARQEVAQARYAKGLDCLQVLPRDTALATAAAYQSMFANEDGSVPATFQVGLDCTPNLEKALCEA
jgi:hypothetical protein